jgi:nicotinate phosphoribosyltransferase
MAGDVVGLEDDDQPGEALIEPVMAEGRRIADPPRLADIRTRAARSLAQLPEGLRRLDPAAAYPVKIADSLVRLAAQCDRRTTSRDRP